MSVSVERTLLLTGAMIIKACYYYPTAGQRASNLSTLPLLVAMQQIPSAGAQTLRYNRDGAGIMITLVIHNNVSCYPFIILLQRIAIVLHTHMYTRLSVQ